MEKIIKAKSICTLLWIKVKTRGLPRFPWKKAWYQLEGRNKNQNAINIGNYTTTSIMAGSCSSSIAEQQACILFYALNALWIGQCFNMVLCDQNGFSFEKDILFSDLFAFLLKALYRLFFELTKRSLNYCCCIIIALLILPHKWK